MTVTPAPPDANITAVIDLDPGRHTEEVTGPDAVGAGQGTGVEVAIATLTV